MAQYALSSSLTGVKRDTIPGGALALTHPFIALAKTIHCTADCKESKRLAKREED